MLNEVSELARSSTEVNKDDTREKIQSFILHYSGRAVLSRDQLHRHAANSGRGRAACRGTGCRCRRREGGGAQRRSPRAVARGGGVRRARDIRHSKEPFKGRPETGGVVHHKPCGVQPLPGQREGGLPAVAAVDGVLRQ